MSERPDSSTVSENFWFRYTLEQIKNAGLEDLLFLRSLYKDEMEKTEQKMLAVNFKINQISKPENQ